MKTKFLLAGVEMFLMLAIISALHADVVEMQNGDRYSGRVLSVSADTVVLNSEMLGKINVPRKKVMSLTFGTNAVALTVAGNPALARTNLPSATAPAALANTNVDLSAALRHLGANTNYIGQIRQQMLAGSPEATAKFDDLVNGLLTGQLNVNDVRRQAQSAAAQLRSLKAELSPEAGDSLDAYLQVLDSFVQETANQPANSTALPKPPAP